ncbi:MAG: methyl-accepting chemotaxis protein, partial [Deltaproteobacteria bacterium]|nr:methyl-accepting chemotaxis protein [Deltaproteobacteria bacterium]
EQSQGINQITTAMSQMDKVTQSNAASAEESASAASQLSLQAGTLMSAVEDMTLIIDGAKSGGKVSASASPGASSSGGSRRAPAPAQAPIRPKAQALAPPPKRAARVSEQAKQQALPMDNDDDFEF